MSVLKTEALVYLSKRKEGGCLIGSLYQTLESRFPNITEKELSEVLKSIHGHSGYTIKKGFILKNRS